MSTTYSGYLGPVLKVQLKEMPVENVYFACLLFERLEGHDKVRGNGHHMAQYVSKYATDLLKERWNNK